jgi:hypothetical protein
MADRVYYKSVSTPVLRRMWEKLRNGLASLPPEDRPVEDMESLVAMRDELDRRSGIQPAEVEFTDFLTD